MMMITNLPIDLITDILSRLPARTLVRLKIVCKSWHNLINNDHFVNYHLERSISTKTNMHFAGSTRRMYRHMNHSCLVLYSADFDSFDNSVELSHPFKICEDGIWVLGSCRGLLMLRVGFGHMLLYNPTTQTYNVLPFLSEHRPGPPDGQYEYGFGYDSVSMDFKCVRIFQCRLSDRNIMCEVMVYSMKTNSWKRVADFPCYFPPFGWHVGTLLHENFHWVGRDYDTDREVMVAFRFRDETFSFLPLPNFCQEEDDPRYALYVGTIDDCLCLLDNKYRLCNVWLMKEYGVVGSWTRMYCISKAGCYNLERPITYSADKKQLLVKKALCALSYIDLESLKDSANLTFSDMDGGLDAYVYVENLLMLDFNEFGIDIDSEKEKGVKNEEENEEETQKHEVKFCYQETRTCIRIKWSGRRLP